jgi:hypothetical protein
MTSRPRYVLEAYMGRVDGEFAVMIAVGGVDLAYEVRVTIGWQGRYRGQIESAMIASTHYGACPNDCAIVFADRELPIGLVDWLKSNDEIASITEREWRAFLEDCAHEVAQGAV